jgi:formylglycine-generating enzyme required for sulfatase activity
MLPGDKIGNYALVRELGRGGFGVVWLAEKRSAFTTTQFALKLPRRDEVDLELIRHEAVLWTQASGHPNILPIIEADEFDGQIVIVSEFAPDGSLNDWLQKNGKKAASINSAIEMTQGILSGLEHLHNRKIIHRDLKPDNILLQGEVPRLADFGISRISKTGSLTSNISGTLEYMAPEAFDGKRNVQTDLWAVGIILYEMLAGFNPYNPTGQLEMTSLIGAIVMKDLPPLSLDIPMSVRLFVEKALEKSPEKRFSSAREMRQALVICQRQIDAIEPNVGLKTNIIQVPDPQITIPLLPSPSAFYTNKIETPALPTVELEQSPPTLNEIRTIPATPKPTYSTPTGQIAAPEKRPINWGLKAAAVVFCLCLLGAVGSVPMLLNSEAFSGFRQNQSVGNSANNTAVSNLTAATPVSKPMGNSNQSTAKTITIILSNDQAITFVQIPDGKFVMGSPETEIDREEDESPQKEISINYWFYLGQKEITQGQWTAVMSDNPSFFKDCGEDCPVENISWNDAQEFLEKLNALKTDYKFRLPSESEWEYAARAGTKTANCYGESLDSTKANFDGNHPYNKGVKGRFLKKPDKVGSFQPNAFGLYDMHGNVWEWIADFYQEDYANLPTDGSLNLTNGDTNYRVIRGGAWDSEGRVLRSANRNWMVSNERRNNFGLRIVAQPK